MIKLTKRLSSIVFIPLLLVMSCAGVATSGFNKNNTVGRDVDEVITEINKNGVRCSNKASVKGFSGKMIGAVNCGIKEKSLICPKSYGIYLSYDLATNKVTSILKDERENCF